MLRRQRLGKISVETMQNVQGNYQKMINLAPNVRPQTLMLSVNFGNHNSCKIKPLHNLHTAANSDSWCFCFKRVEKEILSQNLFIIKVLYMSKIKRRIRSLCFRHRGILQCLSSFNFSNFYLLANIM